MKYYILAAEQGNMKSIDIVIRIYCDKEAMEKYIYKIIYYCKKYIKLSETKEYNKDTKEQVTGLLSELSSLCGLCSKKAVGYKCCSKCTCNGGES